MTPWERCLCPDCTLVWERNLDGAWRYIARIAVPVPAERACPACASNLRVQWMEPLPVLPKDEK
ncbi:MAG: hypothetical protein J2P37_06705 [Ktedonobacteraceae bacterium]|nr:hypothetical protein [Ktedonobacteraceae bacterium]